MNPLTLLPRSPELRFSDDGGLQVRAVTPPRRGVTSVLVDKKTSQPFTEGLGFPERVSKLSQVR